MVCNYSELVSRACRRTAAFFLSLRICSTKGIINHGSSLSRSISGRVGLREQPRVQRSAPNTQKSSVFPSSAGSALDPSVPRERRSERTKIAPTPQHQEVVLSFPLWPFPLKKKRKSNHLLSWKPLTLFCLLGKRPFRCLVEILSRRAENYGN